MQYDWKDTVLLITGASKGIGSNVVRMALEEGVKQVFNLDIDEEGGVKIQNELNEKYGADKVKFIKCDLINEEQLEETFKSVLSDKSNTYVVINNAGILNDSWKTYKTEIKLNVAALVTGSLLARELMRKDKGGKGGTIINIASTVALYPLACTPIYNCTKSAVLTFSTGLGSDEYYLSSGVRVLTICFGATSTGLLELSNLGTFDIEVESQIPKFLLMHPHQKVESAAKSVIEMYKQGSSGSTWLSNANRPVEDITSVVKKAYSILTEPIFAD